MLPQNPHWHTTPLGQSSAVFVQTTQMYISPYRQLCWNKTSFTSTWPTAQSWLRFKHWYDQGCSLMHGILNLITTSCPYSLQKYFDVDIKMCTRMNLKCAANHYTHFQVNEIFTLLNCRIQIFHFQLLILGHTTAFILSWQPLLPAFQLEWCYCQIPVYCLIHFSSREIPHFALNFNHVRLHQSRMKLCFRVPKQTCKNQGASCLSACVLNRMSVLLLNCHVPSKGFQQHLGAALGVISRRGERYYKITSAQCSFGLCYLALFLILFC